MSQPLHKQASAVKERPRYHCIQSSWFQWHHSGPIIIKNSALTRFATLTPSVMGIVWKIQMQQLEGSHFRIEEAAPRVLVYSSPVVCPNCSCQIHFSAHIDIQSNSTGELVDVSLRKIYILRVPASTRDRFLRHIICAQHDFCRPLTYYILVKVHMEGDRGSREITYWKITQ